MIQTMTINDKAGRVTTYCQKLANIYLHRGDVVVRHANGYLAYCVVKKGEIYMDYRVISEQYCANDDEKALILSLALNYHEIQHLEMTRKPRNLRHDALSVHNILEDGRIETLGVKKFDKLADYFHHAVCTILLKEGVVSPVPINNLTNYILLYGRKIFIKGNPAIPTSRAVCVKLFTEDVVQKVEKHVDDYLISSTQFQRGQISNDVASLIKSLNKGSPSIPLGVGQENIEGTENDSDAKDSIGDTDGVDRASLEEENRKAKTGQGKELKSTQDSLKDIAEILSKAEEVLKEKKEKEKEYNDFLVKARRELDIKKRNNNEEKAKKMREGIIKTQNKRDGLNASVEEKVRGINNQIACILQGIGDAVEGKLSEELKTIKQTITDDAYADLTTFCVDSDAEAQVNKIAKNMHKLNIELGRGNVSHQVAGRLNVRSFINRKDKADLKIFDKYIPSRLNRSKMLVNIFLDASGSMRQSDGTNKSDRWSNAKKSTWILANSLERHENQVMCIAWSDLCAFQTFKEYGKILKAPPLNCTGNTYPEGALGSSLKKIQDYKKRNGFKAVMSILVTDGDFNDNSAVYNAVQKYVDAGHHFVLVKVGKYFNNCYSEPPAHESMRIEDFNQLSDMVIKTFTRMKKSLNKQVK
jgi:hypothetical protein